MVLVARCFLIPNLSDAILSMNGSLSGASGPPFAVTSRAGPTSSQTAATLIPCRQWATISDDALTVSSEGSPVVLGGSGNCRVFPGLDPPPPPSLRCVSKLLLKLY